MVPAVMPEPLHVRRRVPASSKVVVRRREDLREAREGVRRHTVVVVVGQVVLVRRKAGRAVHAESPAPRHAMILRRRRHHGHGGVVAVGRRVGVVAGPRRVRRCPGAYGCKLRNHGSS